MPAEQLQCYNRGCGQKYVPEQNNEDSCRHHPGVPYFHDAYKGWSCCNKKCTDFTEFLNIKGCTLSKHSNIKPPEPEKLKAADIPDTEVIEVKPIIAQSLQRPSFDGPMTIITPEIAPSLKKQLESIEKAPTEKVEDNGLIALGTSCKNGGCTTTYQGPDTDKTACVHHPDTEFHMSIPIHTKESRISGSLNMIDTEFHMSIPIHTKESRISGSLNMIDPQLHMNTHIHVKRRPSIMIGVPIFHEGMKYWSCCQRKTSDFNAFLSQVGCKRGTHLWKKENEGDNTKVDCRWDYHQTGSYVIVAIYAKQYSPSKTVIKLNPIRLFANLVFPQQSDASFTLDLELRGIIDVAASQVTMYGTKVELKLKKAEAGKWNQLAVPRLVPQAAVKKVESNPVQNLQQKVDDVDLSDL